MKDENRKIIGKTPPVIKELNTKGKLMNISKKMAVIQSITKNAATYQENLEVLIETLKEMNFTNDQIKARSKEMEEMEMEQKIKIANAADKLGEVGKQHSFKQMVEIAFPDKHEAILAKVKEKLSKRLRDKLGTEDENWIYRAYDIPENDSLRGFQAFLGLFKDTFKTELKDTSDELNSFTNDIGELALNSKVFDIEDDVADVLSLTDAPKTNLPYDNLFLSGKFKINDKTGDRIYHGILLFTYADERHGLNDKNGEFVVNDDKDLGIALISAFSQRNEDGEMAFQVKMNQLDKEDKGGWSWEYDPKLSSLIYSFANFINEPELKIVHIERSKNNNKRREEKGRVCIPQSNSKIILHGKLKRFVEEFKYTSIKGKASHKFWVRGHFFHLRNKEAFPRLYALEEGKLKEMGYNVKDGLIVGWKKPHISGKGILISKTYEVKK